MLWDLFTSFLLVGFVSFGGGYAMIPLIKHEVVLHNWMTAQDLTEVIAVSGISPGPIATNSAVIIGYDLAGLPGAIVSSFATVLPSFIVIFILVTFLSKVWENKWVAAAFYGIRPIVTGLIVFAAIDFAYSNHVIGRVTWHMLSLFLIFTVSLVALIRFRTHPVYIILLSGLVGAAIYG